MKMKYLSGVRDLGIVLSPDVPGEPFYEWDGGGIREAILNKECTGPDKGMFYLSYDGAAPGKTPTSYWNACTARSRDLIHWEKLGPSLICSALTHPDSSCEIYKDFCSASSPWAFFENGRWYRYYVGADHCSPNGVPAFQYSTMLAEAETLRGPWIKRCDKPGCEKHICFPAGAPGTWDDVTVSPGVVLHNPHFKKTEIAADCQDDTDHTHEENEKPYLMFYSGACSGVTRRSLGIARTNDLTVSDDYDKLTGTFWEKDPTPILPIEDDIENSSIFYEESSGLWWLFTNHIYKNSYTNSVWVYWSDDVEHWNPEHKAIVVDASVSTWAKGAIGMPTVIQKDDHTLTLLYDGICGDGIGHLDRRIGMCEISLPLSIK